MTNWQWQFSKGGVLSGGVVLSASDALALHDFVVNHSEKLLLMFSLDVEGQGREVCSIEGCMNVCEYTQTCDYCSRPVCEHHQIVTAFYDSTFGITSYSYSCPDALCTGLEPAPTS